MLLSVGNLATTQAVVSQLKLDLQSNTGRSLSTVSETPETADYIGQVSVAT
jgi:predicted proteasome-type protease